MSSVFKKYHSLSKASKAGIWFVIANMLQKGISFLITPIYTRILSTEEYGYYSMFATWHSIFLTVTTLSLFNAVINNGLSKYESSRQEYISCLQGLGGITTIIWVIVVTVFRSFFERIVGLEFFVIICLLLTLIFYPSYLYWTMYQRFLFNYKSVVVSSVIYSTLTPIVCLLFISCNVGKYGIVYGTLLVQFAFGLSFFIYNYTKGKKLFNKPYWEYSARFNIPLIPHYLSGMILGQADRIIITSIVGLSAAGIYSLAYNISSIVTLIISGIVSSFTPWVYQRLKQKDTNGVSRRINDLCLLVGGIGLLAILLAPELISVLGPNDYYEGIWVVPPIIIGCYFFFLFNCFAIFELYYEGNYGVMLSSLFAAGINILLNYLLIPLFGYQAAAYTTLVSYLLLALAHGVLYYVIANRNSVKDVIDLRYVVVFSITITVISQMCLKLYLHLYIRCGIMAILFAVIFIFRKRIIQKLR